MAAEYRLTTAPLPDDPAERTKIRAAAIAEALTHAATAADFRLEMIVGEAYARYLGVVDWLAGEIEKEGPGVQGYARMVAGGWSASVAEVHKTLLADAVRQSILSESPCPKITSTGSTGS
jgi:hypothetical protein